jgi:hypothetical protein
MKLSDIQSMWAEDARIDETNLSASSLNIPNLHAKYLALLSNTKLSLRKAESDYFRLRKRKYRYYRGEMSKQELLDEGWEQWLGAKPLKNEMDEFLSTDDDLLLLQDKVEYFKTVIFHLEQIMKSLNSRTWDIKNSIEFMKWSQGGY